MMLAPTPRLDSTHCRIANGVRGVRETLAAMRALVREGRVDTQVRQAAASIIWLQPEKDSLHEVTALYEFVRDRVRYVRDVLDVETLSTPAKTLAQMIGDCDDQTTLLAAMLESVGYPTRFVVAAYTLPGHFEHVFLQVDIDGEWVCADPTEREFLGWYPPDALTTAIEGAV